MIVQCHVEPISGVPAHPGRSERLWKCPGALCGYFEKFQNNPEVEAKKLIKFCNLNWDKKCLKFYDNVRPIKTASDSQARKKIYKTSVNIWKNYNAYLKKYFLKLKS